METETKSSVKHGFYRGVLVAAFVCAATIVFFLQNRTQFDPDYLEKGLAAYENGKYDDALKYFSSGAENDDPQSLFILGAMHLNGLGVEKNPQKAEELYLKAAQNGYLPAITTLSVLYAAGDVLPEDREAAMALAVQAAQMGDVDAQLMAATWYENGFAGVKDVEQAVKWYTKAARNGEKNAKMALALIYREGKGRVPPNIHTAKRWYDSIEKQSVYEKRFQGETLDISR